MEAPREDSAENPFESFAKASRLSRIETAWSMVHRAHQDEPTLSLTAQQTLLNLYGGAIRRYLSAALKDPEAVEDLFQNFAVRFVQGDFQGLDPERGRFRSFVKTVLFRMVAEHRRHHSRRMKHEVTSSEVVEHLAEDEAMPSVSEEITEQQYLASWREELLSQAWEALAEHDQRTGTNYYLILRVRVEDPTRPGDAFAQAVSDRIGQPLSPGAARVALHRARERFAQLIMEAVAQSLPDTDAHTLESELIELGLITYCRPVQS